MTYPNNPQLTRWLRKDHPDLAERSAFSIDPAHFERHRGKLVEQADTPEEQLDDLAVFVCLTHDEHQERTSAVETPALAQPPGWPTELLNELRDLRRWIQFIAALLLIFGLASIARSQNVNPAIVVPTCGTAPSPYPASGGRAPLIVDVNGNLCSGVTVNATIATAGLAVSVNAGSDSTVGAPTYGRVTTAAPSYTNNTYNALSLDPTGNLRVAGSFSASAPADTVGTLVTLNSSTSAAIVALAGQNGAVLTLSNASSPLLTITPKVSGDGGTTWTTVEMMTLTQVTGAVSQVVNPGNSIYTFVFPGSITHARIEVSAYTSGSIDAQLRAVWTRPVEFPFGIDPNGFWRGLAVGTTGRLWNEIRDAAGNNRGANVNASNQLSVSVDNTPTVTANAGTNLNTSALALESGGNLATLAGVVTSSRAAVNPISGQAGVQGGSGTATALTQRVVLATDVALPTGANTIGAVTQASGPWSQNLTQVNGQTVATNGAGVLAVAGAASSGLLVAIGAGTAGTLGAVTQASGPWTMNLTQVGSAAVVSAATAGMLVVAPGVVEIPAPSGLPTGTYRGLSFDATGALRTAGTSVGATFNGAFPSTGSAIGFNDPLGNMVRANVDYYGNQYVRIASIDTAALPGLRALGGNRITGTFNRPITSTGDALDVNLKYPPAMSDPCQGRKGFVAISQALSAQVITATPGFATNICGIFVTGSDAENISLVYGTGTTCATGTVAIIGGTTAANGANMAANGGWVEGFANSSIGVAPPGQNVCLQQSGTGRVAGNIAVAFSP